MEKGGCVEVHAAELDRVASHFDPAVHGIDTICLVMEAVVAVLVYDEQQDEQACADADGKAADVDKAIEPVTDEVAPGSFEIVKDHIRVILILNFLRGSWWQPGRPGS